LGLEFQFPLTDPVMVLIFHASDLLFYLFYFVDFKTFLMNVLMALRIGNANPTPMCNRTGFEQFLKH
jgi:hypothetical protein